MKQTGNPLKLDGAAQGPMTNQGGPRDIEGFPILAVLKLGPAVAVGSVAVAASITSLLYAQGVAHHQLDSAGITWAPCASCRIVLDSIARISDGGGVHLSPYAAVAVDSLGSFYVGSLETGGNVYVFASDGRLQNTMGVKGPNALRYVTGIHAGRGDTILVMDAVSRRLDRFSREGVFIDCACPSSKDVRGRTDPGSVS